MFLPVFQLAFGVFLPVFAPHGPQPDLDVFFYTNFRDGEVESGLGELEDSEIYLTMDSDIFDGMFTGKVNAAKAAMKGDLAFSGNVAAAMRLQSLMDDFKRIYLQAKAEA